MSTELQEQQSAPDTSDEVGVAIPGEDNEAVESASSAPNDGGDVESKARSQGWVPREEFRGDPDKWRPADEFVKRGEELLPIALERARAAERRIADLEAQTQEKMNRLERMSQVALKRQRDDLESRYASAMREAAASGDVERYDQLSTGYSQAVKNFDTTVHEQVADPPNAGGLPPEQQTVVQGWVAQNPWFNADPELNMVAQGVHMRLRRDQPGLSLEANLAATRKEVAQRYPERFGIKPASTVRAAVEPGGGRMPASNAPRVKSAHDLPSDVRAVAERFVKQGLFKDVGEYAKEYFADN